MVTIRIGIRNFARPFDRGYMPNETKTTDPKIDPESSLFDLAAFAEHHKQIGMALGRAEKLREIIAQDEILYDKAEQTFQKGIGKDIT